jgi:hypothetical protein
MSTNTTSESPWTRPGFLASSGVVALIIVLGIFLAVVNLTHSDGADQVAIRRSGSAASTTAGGDATPSPSICALPGLETRIGDLDFSSTVWRYGSTTAYPTSPTYGPGRMSGAGYRYCFQHSVGGALFAAANSIAFDNTSRAAATAWSHYILADGPYRQQRLTDDYVATDPDMRLQIAGFRIIGYDQHNARIDIAVRTATLDETMIVSLESDLVWQRGDWRLSTDVPESVTVARVPDLTGYIAWGGA